MTVFKSTPSDNIGAKEIIGYPKKGCHFKKRPKITQIYFKYLNKH